MCIEAPMDGKDEEILTLRSLLESLAYSHCGYDPQGCRFTNIETPLRSTGECWYCGNTEEEGCIYTCPWKKIHNYLEGRAGAITRLKEPQNLPRI